jgi:hypothetical protein
MRYSRNRRGREEASASIWCQDGIATETTTRYQLGKNLRLWIVGRSKAEQTHPRL